MIGAPAEKKPQRSPYLRGIARVADPPTIDDTLPERLGVSSAKNPVYVAVRLSDRNRHPAGKLPCRGLVGALFQALFATSLGSKRRSFVHAVRINQPARLSW